MSKPYIDSRILSKELCLPRKYIQRFRNQHGIYLRKKIDIDIDEFISIYDQLKSSDKVAIYFGVSDSYVVKFAKQIGYTNTSYKIPEEIEKNVVKEYIAGINNDEILKKYKISSTSLYRILTRNNINRAKDKKRYRINEHVFDDIDSDEKAYLIGFIAADGGISEKQFKLTISISKKDEEILYFFKTILETDKPIESYNKHGFDYATLSITNKHLVECLMKIGLRERKTWKNTIVNIDKKYLKGFIRGYFDGDGSISSNTSSPNVCISGFENNILKIIAKLRDVNILASFNEDKREYNTSKETGKFGCLSLTNKLQKYCFLKWMYDIDNCIYLKRKYQRAQKYIQRIESSGKITDQQAVIYYKTAVCE